MDMIVILGFTAAALTTLAGVPQFIKTVRTKDTRSLSVHTYIMLAVGVFLWLVYGVLRADWPLIFSNALVFIPILVILLLKLKNE